MLAVGIKRGEKWPLVGLSSACTFFVLLGMPFAPVGKLCLPTKSLCLMRAGADMTLGRKPLDLQHYQTENRFPRTLVLSRIGTSFT